MKKEQIPEMAKNRTKNIKKRKSGQRNNFQDRFAAREKKKGFEEGLDYERGSDRANKFMGQTIQKSNDPQWYFKDAAILRDVASFSFNSPLGMRTGADQFLKGDVSEDGTVNEFKYLGSGVTIPGILSIQLGLSVGVAQTAQDPINLAATNLYSFVRYKNSGAKNYDAPDLMLYMVAMDSIYACWNWLKRIYGVASTYSQLNRYMPTGYFALENVDMADVLANLADFRAWLNMKTYEISAFCVPATMTYLVRHSWLFSNIFMDSETRKAQQYMYVPSFFYTYDETSSPNGGLLVAQPTPGSVFNKTRPKPYKVEDLKAILNGLLEAVNYSEDIGVMSGDILKAYGEGGLFKVSPIDPDYRVLPVYSREVLTQFENAIMSTFGPKDLSSFNILQDPNTNFIKHTPYTTESNVVLGGRYINFHWNNPTPEDVIVATRLTCVLGNNAGGNTRKIPVLSLGSEIAVKCEMAIFTEQNYTTGKLATYTGPLEIYLERIDLKNGLGVGTPEDADRQYDRLAAVLHLTAFDWSPMAAVYTHITANNNRVMLGISWDFDNYTFVHSRQLEAMNTLALLTEFNVPN